MRRPVLAVLALALALPAGARADAVAGRVIVGFAAGVSRERQDALLDKVGARVVTRLGAIRAAAVAPRGDGRLSALREALERDGRVRYVEPDFYLHASKTPNDPDYAKQYALAASGDGSAGVPAAWDRATSCAPVAVLDSGVQYGHPDLADNVWHNPDEVKGNGKDDDKNGYVDDYYGVDLVDGSGSASDENGHGTHVSGIIGGRGNNATGIAGLCWSVHIVAVKFLNARGKGSTSDAIDGIRYAVRRGVKVINGSFGSSAKSEALEDAVDYAKDKGVLLVFAAGNDGDDVERDPIYPASYPDGNILAVASITSRGELADYSNFGATSVDLGAPGDAIWSTYPTSSYKKLSGTSMASPLVAATAALLRKRDTSLTYGQLRTAIRTTVEKTSALSGKTVTGGKLDVEAALASIAPARAAAVGCGALEGRVVRETAALRIVAQRFRRVRGDERVVGVRLRGCARPDGRVRTLGFTVDHTDGGDLVQSRTTLFRKPRGEWILRFTSVGNESHNEAEGEVLDVRTGHHHGFSLQTYDAYGSEPTPPLCDSLEPLATRLDATGLLAAVFEGDDGDRTVRTVEAFTPDGTRKALDQQDETALDPASLRLRGGVVSWTAGGEPRGAGPIGPATPDYAEGLSAPECP